jgi:hypothetical protein
MTAETMTMISLGFLAMWIFWYGFWKDYVVDKFRQDMFKLRNDFFYDTLTGNAPFGFDSREYRRMVEVMNVSIRHVESMSVLRFGLMYFLKCFYAPNVPIQIIDQRHQPITADTPEETKKFLQEYQCVHGKFTLRYLLTVSPTFVIMGGTIVAYAVVRALHRVVTSRINQAGEAFWDVLRNWWRSTCTEVGIINELSASNLCKR